MWMAVGRAGRMRILLVRVLGFLNVSQSMQYHRRLVFIRAFVCAQANSCSNAAPPSSTRKSLRNSGQRTHGRRPRRQRGRARPSTPAGRTGQALGREGEVCVLARESRGLSTLARWSEVGLAGHRHRSDTHPALTPLRQQAKRPHAQAEFPMAHKRGGSGHSRKQRARQNQSR